MRGEKQEEKDCEDAHFANVKPFSVARAAVSICNLKSSRVIELLFRVLCVSLCRFVNFTIFYSLLPMTKCQRLYPKTQGHNSTHVVHHVAVYLPINPARRDPL